MWFKPVILATSEAEIWRITEINSKVKQASQAISKQTKKTIIKPHFNGKNLSVMAHTCHPKYSGKYRLRGARCRLTWTKSEKICPK
jgi:hypothetical protein